MLERVRHQARGAQRQVEHEREAEIVAQAGRNGAVTIATNMAGRGTDIILGGNPEFMAWADLKRQRRGRPARYPTRLDVPDGRLEAGRREVRAGDEGRGPRGRRAGRPAHHRHRAAREPPHRQPAPRPRRPPGRPRLVAVLPVARRRPDAHVRRRVGRRVLTRLGMEEGEAIESRMVSRRIEGAQKKVEERNFDIRKNLLEYDEVMDQQRKRVYSFRQSLLDGDAAKDTILEMIDDQIDDAVDRFLADDYGTASFAEWVGQRLGVELTPRDLKGASFEDAERDRQAPRPSASSTRRSARPSRRTSPPTPTRRSGPGRPWRTGPTPGSG